MNRTLPSLLIGCLLAGLSAHGATITFNTPANCAADSDVIVSGGGQLFAYTWGGAATVNGLPFTATTVSSGAVGPNLTLATFTGANASAFTAGAAPFNALSGSYSNILKGSLFNGTAGTVATATLNNLVVGRKYFVQLWSSDPRAGATTNRTVNISSGGGAAVTMRFNSTLAAGGVGQFTSGTLTADNSTQDITLDGSTPPAGFTGLPQINAIQLRDITGVWSGTTSGNWDNNDSTSQNFSGSSYTTVKAATTDVYFGDKDATGNAVATAAITVTAGGVTGANANFNNNSLAYMLSSADANGISGAYGLTVSGSGTVTLNGANTYSGNTTLSGGTLALGNSSAVGGSGTILLNGGTLDTSALTALTLGSSQTLTGVGSLNGSLTASAGSTIIPGGVGSASTITVTNNLTLNGQTMTFDLSFGPSGGDKIVVGNGLTVNSTCTLHLNYLYGSLAGGTYTLMTFASKSGSGTFVLDTTYPGVTLNVNPTSVTLTVAGGGGTSGTWTNLLGGAWAGATNWAGNTIASNVDGIADFSTLNITGARAVTVNGIKTIGHLVFGDTVQDNNWSLTTGTNILAVSAGSPKIIVNSGQSTTISASLQGTQGFTKIGAGTLTLSGGNFLSNGIAVSAGALVASVAGSFGNNTFATNNAITLSNAMLTISAALANNAWTNNLICQGTSNNITAGAATPGFRGTAGGSSVLSGGGILTFNCSGNTPALAGHMDGFNGTLTINGTSGGGLLMGMNQDSGFYPAADGITGSSSAVFDYEGAGVNYMYNGAMPSTNYLGELRGNASAVLWAKNGRSGAVTLEIGGKGTSSEFDGTFKDNKMGASPYTPINVRKVGGGTLTLGGANANTGYTDVRGGTLLVNSSGSLSTGPITVQSGATFELSGSIGSTNVTILGGGKLMVDASGNLGSAPITLNGLMDVSAWAGSFTLGTASLSGSGVVTGAVTLASTSLNPGPNGGAGTLTITNGDFTANGGTITFDLSSTPAGGNDLLDVNGSLNFNTPGVVININKISGLLGAGTYTLAKCSGSLNGSASNLTLTGANPGDMLQFNGNRLQLVVNTVPGVTWTGDGAANSWDIGVSTDWLSGSSHVTYADGYAVTFDNTGSTNPVVNIPATVMPSTMTVAGSPNYTIQGAGDIGGGAALIKNGSGTLTLLNTNTLSGTVFVNSGALAVGNGSVNGSLPTSITNNAALIITTPLDQIHANSMTGPGSLTKSGPGQLILNGDSTVSGPTTISAGTLALGDGTATSGSLGTGVISNNATLAINRADPFALNNPVVNFGGMVNLATGPVSLAGAISGSGALTNDVAAGRLNLAAGSSYSGGTFINGGMVMLQNFSGMGVGAVAIAGGASLHLAPPTGTTNVVANNINLPSDTTQQFEMDGTSMSTRTTVRLTGLLSGGAVGSITRWVDSGISLNNRGVLVLENVGNTFTTIPEVFRGTLAFTSDGALGDAGNGIQVNAANNSGAPFDPTQQGMRFDANNIALGAGRTINLVGTENIDVQNFNGSIAGPITGVGLNKYGSGTLTINGSGSLAGNTTVNAGTLIINNTWSGAGLVVNSGATLGGSGTITAPLSVLSGGTLSPGASIGTLAVSNVVTLSSGSTTTMEINAGTLACDKVIGVTTVTYNGTLNVVNLAGTLAQGQSFQLFSATNYTGSFAVTNLPALGGGLKWNWAPASGTLSVVGGVGTNPIGLTYSNANGALNFYWPADHIGWDLQTQTNTLGTNWQTWPGSASTNFVAVPINPANPAVFFRLHYLAP